MRSTSPGTKQYLEPNATLSCARSTYLIPNIYLDNYTCLISHFVLCVYTSKGCQSAPGVCYNYIHSIWPYLIIAQKKKKVVCCQLQRRELSAAVYNSRYPAPARYFYLPHNCLVERRRFYTPATVKYYRSIYRLTYAVRNFLQPCIALD